MNNKYKAKDEDGMWCFGTPLTVTWDYERHKEDQPLNSADLDEPEFEPYTVMQGYTYRTNMEPSSREAEICNLDKRRVVARVTDILEETLCWYTGYNMFDVEVYVGDIVSNNYQTPCEVLREVVWHEGALQLKRICGNSRMTKYISLHECYQLNYKVVGNRHDAM